MAEKQRIRETCLTARRALDTKTWEAKSAAVRGRLQGLAAFYTARTVLTYVSSKDREVDTQRIIETLLAAERRVFVPVTHGGGAMTWLPLTSLRALRPGRFGILEPAPGKAAPLEPPPNGVVLVPGIAFTRTGNRIGYGGGYFDRFLAGFDGVKVGLAFDCQLVPVCPPERHDVPVDVVVTESAVWHAIEDGHTIPSG